MTLIVLGDDDAGRHLRAALLTYRARLVSQRQPVPDVVERVIAHGDYAPADPAGDAAPTWLSRSEAARRAGVSVRTLDRWRGDGLADSRRGGRVVIARDTLDTYVSTATRQM